MEYKFEFVAENMSREQANALGDMIVLFAETYDLLVGGNVHGNEIEEEQLYLCPDCNHIVVPTIRLTCPNCGHMQDWGRCKVDNP